MVFSLHAHSWPGDLRVLLAFPEASSLRESSSVQEASELALFTWADHYPVFLLKEELSQSF